MIRTLTQPQQRFLKKLVLHIQSIINDHHKFGSTPPSHLMVELQMIGTIISIERYRTNGFIRTAIDGHHSDRAVIDSWKPSFRENSLE